MLSSEVRIDSESNIAWHVITSDFFGWNIHSLIANSAKDPLLSHTQKDRKKETYQAASSVVYVTPLPWSLQSSAIEKTIIKLKPSMVKTRLIPI